MSAGSPLVKSNTFSTAHYIRDMGETDVTVIVPASSDGSQSSVYQLHRKVLTRHSKYFKNALKDAPSSEPAYISLPTPDRGNAFNFLVKFMYTGARSWSFDNKFSVATMAFDLGMAELLHTLKAEVKRESTETVMNYFDDAMITRKTSQGIINFLISELCHRLVLTKERSVFFKLPTEYMRVLLKSSELEIDQMGSFTEFITQYLKARERSGEKITLPCLNGFNNLADQLSTLRSFIGKLKNATNTSTPPAKLVANIRSEFYSQISQCDKVEFFQFKIPEHLAQVLGKIEAESRKTSPLFANLKEQKQESPAVKSVDSLQSVKVSDTPITTAKKLEELSLNPSTKSLVSLQNSGDTIKLGKSDGAFVAKLVQQESRKEVEPIDLSKISFSSPGSTMKLGKGSVRKARVVFISKQDN
jgi:hypothetical protein